MMFSHARAFQKGPLTQLIADDLSARGLSPELIETYLPGLTQKCRALLPIYNAMLPAYGPNLIQNHLFEQSFTHLGVPENDADAHLRVINSEIKRIRAPQLAYSTIVALSVARAADQTGKADEAFFFSRVSSGFVNGFMKGMLSFSPEERAILARSGVRFAGARTVLDMRGILGCIVKNDSANRTQANHFSGLFWPDKNIITIPQWILDASADQEKNPRPSVSSIVTNTYRKTPDIEVPAIVRHEASHAIDHLILPRFLSRSPRFQRAVRDDLAALGGIVAVIDRGYSCFVKPEGLVHEELFAELSAEARGGSKCGSAFANDFSEAYKLTRDIHQAFSAACKRICMRDPAPSGLFVSVPPVVPVDLRRADFPARAPGFCTPGLRSEMWAMLYDTNAPPSDRPAFSVTYARNVLTPR